METQEKPEVTRQRKSTSIYTIRTTIGQEKSVAELIANRVKIHDLVMNFTRKRICRKNPY